MNTSLSTLWKIILGHVVCLSVVLIHTPLQARTLHTLGNAAEMVSAAAICVPAILAQRYANAGDKKKEAFTTAIANGIRVLNKIAFINNRSKGVPQKYPQIQQESFDNRDYLVQGAWGLHDIHAAWTGFQAYKKIAREENNPQPIITTLNENETNISSWEKNFKTYMLPITESLAAFAIAFLNVPEARTVDFLKQLGFTSVTLQSFLRLLQEYTAAEKGSSYKKHCGALLWINGLWLLGDIGNCYPAYKEFIELCKSCNDDKVIFMYAYFKQKSSGIYKDLYNDLVAPYYHNFYAYKILLKHADTIPELQALKHSTQSVTEKLDTVCSTIRSTLTEGFKNTLDSLQKAEATRLQQQNNLEQKYSNQNLNEYVIAYEMARTTLDNADIELARYGLKDYDNNDRYYAYDKISSKGVPNAIAFLLYRLLGLKHKYPYQTLRLCKDGIKEFNQTIAHLNAAERTDVETTLRLLDNFWPHTCRSITDGDELFSPPTTEKPLKLD